MTPPRQPWHDYFLSIAEAASTRSTCPRLSVGAVLVLDKDVVATGYNGAPRGEPHCTDVGCLIVPCVEHGEHCMRTIHGEKNAALSLARTLAMPTPLTPEAYIESGEWHDLAPRLHLFITHEPCIYCRQWLENTAGITYLYWRSQYHNQQQSPTYLP